MLVSTVENVDLGTVKLGQPYRFKYKLINNGDKVVKIENVVLGCGSCTEVEPIMPYIGVGGSTDVQVTFTPNSTGINNKRISVNYLNGTNLEEPLILKFSALVNQ